MSDYRFRCLGPFPFPSSRSPKGLRVIEVNRARDIVFGKAEGPARRAGITDIRAAIGLYVMGLSPSGTSRTWPHYVGKASKQALFTRCFQPSDKPEVYGRILNYYEKATPFMYLFPMVTAAGNQVRRPDSDNSRIHKVIGDAEYMLIGMAMRVNGSLYNTQHRVAQDRFIVDGTPPASRRETGSAKAFRTMMGFASAEARTPMADAVLKASGAPFPHEEELGLAILEALEGPLEVEPVAEALPQEDGSELFPAEL